MHNASVVNAAGADFWLVAPEKTMIRSRKPVIAVCAVRTGCGKSQTSRYVERFLKKQGIKTVAIRHPMPYGVLAEQTVERFATLADLDKYKTTIEEREDYEPHIRNGFVVYAGVDYEKILKAAEKEADVVIWDGGNNDASFIKADLTITVADPLRAGNELTYYPGETVSRIADVLLLNKVNSATKDEIKRVAADLRSINSKAPILYAKSEVRVDNPELIRGKKVLVVEDGPTITHGGMSIGAGTVAAKKFGARAVVEAKKYAVGTISDTFKKYPKLKVELPAIGYSPEQVRDLRDTINRAVCDSVVSATPTDLTTIMKVNKPIAKVTYELSPVGGAFDMVLHDFVNRKCNK
jgi:predicted GTPase